MTADPRAGTAGLSDVHIEGRTDGLFLTLLFEQRYVNNSTLPVEILYSFPIPCNAVVLEVEAAILGRPLNVAYRELADAEEIYEAAQERRGFVAMVERVSAGLCSVSLGTLRPAGNAVLRLRVGLFVDVANGRGRIVVPTVANYPEGTGAGAGIAGLPSRDFMAEYPLNLRLVLTDHAANVPVSSPTHALSKRARGETATLTFADAVTLDRDVVIILDELPETDAIQVSDSHGVFGVAAFAPAAAGKGRSVDLDVLLDAAGPLGAIAGELLDVLDTLVRLLEIDDQIAIARFGRSVSQLVPKCDAAAAHAALSKLAGIVADIGDVPAGHSLPPLALRDGADILLITDGSTRAASGVCELARTAGRRVFVLAVGAAPNEGILRPAAIAAAGDYAALASGEAIEPALQELLSAIRFAAVSSQGHLEQLHRFGVLWTDGPASSRPARRAMIVAEFERAAMNGGAALAATHRSQQTFPNWRTADAVLASDLVRTVAERRLRSLAGAEHTAWANRFGLARAGDVWVAKASASEPETLGAARLLILPQMIAAGWRGLGISAKRAHGFGSSRTSPKPASAGRRVVSWRRPIVGAAILSIFAGAGTRVWFAARPPPIPLKLADYEPHRPVSWVIWLTVAAASVVLSALVLFWWRARKRSGDRGEASSKRRPVRPSENRCVAPQDHHKAVEETQQR